jgi:putative hydrolase of the HAD superfamily
MAPDTRHSVPRALLCDIGNVLLKFDFSLAARALAVRSEIADPIEVLGRVDQLKALYEDGQIDRGSFVRAACDAIGFRGTEAQFIAAWENIFEPNEPMIALIETLHGCIPLFLLSNTNDIHFDYFTQRYGVFRLFKGGTYSHLAGVSKPSRAIYEIACRNLALEPASTLFIDDLLPNIETARALGFQTHHYDWQRHDELVTALREAGVIRG